MSHATLSFLQQQELAYARWLAQGSLSPHTVQAYQRDVHGLISWFAEQTGPARADQVQLFLMAKAASGLGARSLHRVLSSLRHFFRFLVYRFGDEWDWVAALQAPKRPHTLPDCPDVDNMHYLLQTDEGENTPLQRRDRAMLELFYSSGLRLAELVALDENAIDLQQGLVRVLGKGRKERLVPVGRQARQAIKAWLALRQTLLAAGERALFISTRSGQRLSHRAVQLRVKQWAEQRGMDMHPHRLRHAFASHMLESSGDLRAVQELLGHQDLTATQVYTHVNLQQLMNVYEAAHPRAGTRKKTPL